jgi:hypothetical protein
VGNAKYMCGPKGVKVHGDGEYIVAEMSSNYSKLCNIDREEFSHYHKLNLVAAERNNLQVGISGQFCPRGYRQKAATISMKVCRQTQFFWFAFKALQTSLEAC